MAHAACLRVHKTREAHAEVRRVEHVVEESEVARGERLSALFTHELRCVSAPNPQPLDVAGCHPPRMQRKGIQNKPPNLRRTSTAAPCQS